MNFLDKTGLKELWSKIKDKFATKDEATLNNIVPNNAGSHNGIYRGKDITDLWYDGTLSTEIKNATFDDIYIGDYIIGSSSGRKYLVASLDYYINTGDTRCTTHHVVMIPELCIGSSAAMNSSDTIDGGYVGSAMYTSNLSSAKTIIQNDFTSSHILSHRNLFVNSVNSNSVPNGTTYVSSTIDLMNEEAVYGCCICKIMRGAGSGVGTETMDKTQFPLFQLNPSSIVAYNDSSSMVNWWLRDIAGSTYFCTVGQYGNVDFFAANKTEYIRPAFCIY